ncbi:MAG: hypothetical protein IT371_21115 [Deltaproteobacteria bacterium]|nr:hypothetical protein [Deltaproteobacteria bacterium]
MMRNVPLGLLLTLLAPGCAAGPGAPFSDVERRVYHTIVDRRAAERFAQGSPELRKRTSPYRLYLTFADTVRRDVVAQRVTPGLPELAIAYAWGQPQSVKRSVDSYGVNRELRYCLAEREGELISLTAAEAAHRACTVHVVVTNGREVVEVKPPR